MSFAILFVFAAAAQLSDFPYEVNRAKSTITDYGKHVFRDERLHRRAAKDGSTIETYCATIQYRDGDNRVQETPFYWVLRVRPATGYISDYERGAWEGGGTYDPEQFQKLCIEDEAISDDVLLRSKTHTSDGSLYDPTVDFDQVLTSDWLIGSWVYGSSCATDRGERFGSDGSYEGSAGYGHWLVEQKQVKLSIDKIDRFSADGEMSKTDYYDIPQKKNFEIMRSGFDKATLENKYELIRC